MKKVYFQNEGIIDPVSIVTFGVNAKDTESPIGYFGTGLKYAISVLLRESQKITILAGDEEYNFTTEKKEIRGKEFDIIKMNGIQLGFTTELGKRWKIWQAFRELYCNAIDEDGKATDEEVSHGDSKTTVIVEGNKFHAAYLEKDSIVLNQPKVNTHYEADIHSGSNNAIFYKTIRIYELPKPTKYTYNIKAALCITEDRTAESYQQLCTRLADAIVRMEDKQIIHDIILSEDRYFESELDLTIAYDKPSKEFLEVGSENRLNKNINKSVLAILNKYKKKEPPKEELLNEIQEKQLKKAVQACINMGYNVNTYPIIPTKDLKGGILGLAEEEKIYIAIDVFGYGTKYIAGTLIEEYLHIYTGYADCTRELQNYLFNEIMSFGERLIGEPI